MTLDTRTIENNNNNANNEFCFISETYSHNFIVSCFLFCLHFIHNYSLITSLTQILFSMMLFFRNGEKITVYKCYSCSNQRFEILCLTEITRLTMELLLGYNSFMCQPICKMKTKTNLYRMWRIAWNNNKSFIRTIIHTDTHFERRIYSCTFLPQTLKYRFNKFKHYKNIDPRSNLNYMLII